MDLIARLKNILPHARIKDSLLDRLSYSSDAGFYKLIPQVIVQPESVQEIKELFKISINNKVPLVFRTGGTSLSGQAITDGILVDLSQNWRKVAVEKNGEKIRFQPGVTGSMANAQLKKHHTKIGPDPSSISSAMMGGILSNNSSGMCCGVKHNAYHTLAAIRFVLLNGMEFCTDVPGDYSRFENDAYNLWTGIKDLRAKVHSNPALLKKIRAKYLTKNTVGYSLNAFIDYEHPLDILAHLLVGAEGTLGFIAEAVLNTIPDLPFKATTILYFENIYSACKAIIPIKNSGVEAMELMDRASMKSIEHIKRVPEIIKSLPENAAALLIEYQAATMEELLIKVDGGKNVINTLSLMTPFEFTIDAYEQDFLWKLRKGMFPAVGAIRAQGTTVILEDIAFPLENLADAVADLQKLFSKYNYDNAIIFGHAKDGNLHFVITQSFNTPSETLRYELFMNEVVALVINKYDGTLKAEHGTGRNMAPFVETEWGGDAYIIMKELKQLLDPHNILNPGVIINEDKKAHLKNLKELPVVDMEVDKCMECGYCEHVCPSRDVTSTPRRRIIARREIELLRRKGEYNKLKELMPQYQYQVIDTCAIDGLCANACPVDINTGDLIKKLRKENHNSFSNRIALFVAQNFKLTERLLRFGLKTGISINKIYGNNTMVYITKFLKKIVPTFPLWTNQFCPSTFTPFGNQDNADFVYFSACVSRTMSGSLNGKKTLIDTLISISEKAGIKIFLPELEGTCCSQVFSSKGFKDAANFMANNTIEKLWQWSMEGKLPIVTDASSCTYTFHNLKTYLTIENMERYNQLKIIDSVLFVHDFILPKIKQKFHKDFVVLHPVCSITKMNLVEPFKRIAEACSKKVVVPLHAGCCGMAGDRGFVFPELTAAATSQEAEEVKKTAYNGYYSSAKTCEMAISEAVAHNYESILYLVDEVS